MGRIQSNVGLVTGVPIEETVNQLMQLNSLSRNRLAARNQLLSREQAAVGSLTTLVIGVQLTSDRLGQSSLFSSTRVTSSKSELLSARSTGSPQLGTYSFIPIRQAQSQQLTSSLFSNAQQKTGEGEVTIYTGGFLDQSVGLEQLNGGSGVSGGFIRITDRSGTTRDVDLRFAQTASDVVQAINSTESLAVIAKMEGGRFVLSDVSGSTSGLLRVQEVGVGTTARDLGLADIAVASNTASGADVLQLSSGTLLRNLLDGRGLDLPSTGTALRFTLRDGSEVNFSTALTSNQATLGQLLAEINESGDGKLVARIASDGRRVEVQDLTTGSGNFSISSPTGNLEAQLGLTGAAVAGVISGSRLQAGLNDTLLSSLNGGQGLGTLGAITITDRMGGSDTIQLGSATTLNDVVDTLNAGASNASFRVQLNSTRTGIEIVDTSGGTGNLQVVNADSNNAASKLGIAGDVAAGSIDSKSLNRQFVTRNTLVQDFLGGKTLSASSIRITNSAGTSATLNFGATPPSTMGEVIDRINDLALNLTASINDSGNGLVLVDSAGGNGTMSVQDVGTGTAAAQLRISGSATSIQVSGNSVSGINGSRTLQLTTTDETSLSDLVTQINELSGSPVSANLINLGSSGVRLQLNGRQTGASSRVAIDSSLNLNFTQTSEARDALLSFGATQSGGGVLISSSTDRFTGVVDGLELTVNGISTEPVTVQVSENSDGLTKQIESFVEQYNKLRDRYDELTAFNADTNEVGLLFGSNVALRVDAAFTRLVSSSIRTGQAGSIRSLPEIGVRLNDRGRLTFDKEQFDQAIASNPEAVRDFFTNSTNGFSKRAREVSDSLASVQSGALLARNNSIQQSIEQNTGRIASMDVRLERQRARLLQQFFGMEQAIAKLQRNLTAINQLQIIPPQTTR